MPKAKSKRDSSIFRIINGDDIDYRLIPLQNEVALATQLISEGRIQGAISLAQKAIENFPDHPMPHIIAASAYKEDKQSENCDAEITKLKSILGSDDEVYFRLGEFCLSVELIDQADLYLSKALALTNNSFKVLYHYAKLKMAQKQYPVALEMYKKALPLCDNDYLKRNIERQIKILEEK